MALGGEVDHRRGPVLQEDALDGGAVRDVALHEAQAGVAHHVRQVLEAPGVGELVEHHEAGLGLGEGEPHEVAADEAGAAGDEEGIHEAGEV